jgi:hypothetical protein
MHVLEEVMQRCQMLIKCFIFRRLAGFQVKKTTSLKAIRNTVLSFELFIVYNIIKTPCFGRRPYCLPQVQKYFLGPLERKAQLLTAAIAKSSTTYVCLRMK